jgi:hypothetical protein
MDSERFDDLNDVAQRPQMMSRVRRKSSRVRPPAIAIEQVAAVVATKIDELLKPVLSKLDELQTIADRDNESVQSLMMVSNQLVATLERVERGVVKQDSNLETPDVIREIVEDMPQPVATGTRTPKTHLVDDMSATSDFDPNDDPRMDALESRIDGLEMSLVAERDKYAQLKRQVDDVANQFHSFIQCNAKSHYEHKKNAISENLKKLALSMTPQK